MDIGLMAEYNYIRLFFRYYILIPHICGLSEKIPSYVVMIILKTGHIFLHGPPLSAHWLECRKCSDILIHWCELDYDNEDRDSKSGFISSVVIDKDKNSWRYHVWVV